MLDFHKLHDLDKPENDQEKNCGWTKIETTGKDQPGIDIIMINQYIGKIAHHTSVVH